MTRRQKDPLRPLTAAERVALEQLSRASGEPASHVARARLVLAVAGGQSYTAAARGVGRRSGDAVAQLVARFNEEGLAALAPRHGGGAAGGRPARIAASSPSSQGCSTAFVQLVTPLTRTAPVAGWKSVSSLAVPLRAYSCG